ncbi:2002_t:CDS:2, partial [Gigaspora rosea]
MQDELLKFMHFGEIRRTIEVDQQGTAIALETFKAMSSPNEEN